MTAWEYVNKCYRGRVMVPNSIDGMDVSVIGNIAYLRTDAGVWMRLDAYLREEGYSDWL